MKLIPYIDSHDVQHFVDVTNVMFTETCIFAVEGEPDTPHIKGTRICLDVQSAGFVFSKEPPEVIWDRIHKALSE